MINPLRRLFNSGEKPEQPPAPRSEVSQDTDFDDSPDFDLSKYAGSNKSHEVSNPYQYPSEIPIPSYPDFTTIQKVANTSFAEERGMRVNAVFDAVRPYYNFMVSYEALAGNKALSIEIQRAIRQFILTFWDMPASRNDHHSGRFGLLTHSLQSACESAASVAHNNVVDHYGMDSERSYKERGWLLFGYFIIGLLHDANKIFDYRVRARKSPGSPEVEFQPLSGGLLNFKMTYPSEFTTCTWENFENVAFVEVPHFFFFFLPWKTQLAMPHHIYVDVISQLTQNNEEESKKMSDVQSIMAEINDPKTKKALLSALRKTLQAVFADLDDIYAASVFRLDENWYGADYHTFSSSLAKFMKKSKEYVTRLMYNGKLMGGLTVGTSKPLCFAKFTVFLDNNTQKSGQNKEMCFIKAEIIEPIIADIYREKQSDESVDLSSLAGIRREGVLIHPHYYALAQLFCEVKPLREDVFGSPEGSGSAPQAAEGQAEAGARSVADASGAESLSEMTATGREGEEEPNRDENEDDIFGDIPKKQGRSAKLVTIGSDPADASDRETADDVPEPSTAASFLTELESALSGRHTPAPSAEPTEMTPCEPAAPGPEAGENFSGNPASAENKESENEPESAEIEQEPHPATAVTSEESAGGAAVPAAPEADGSPEEEQEAGAEAIPDEESFLDEDGLPTRNLAKAMMPLFVINFLLYKLPGQIKTGNDDECAFFVSRNGGLYIARNTTFEYLWKFAKSAGFLPQDAELRPGAIDRLTNFWVEMNYLQEKPSPGYTTTYTNVSLFDKRTSKWDLGEIVFKRPYTVKYQQMSKEISIKSIPEIAQFADKTFAQLVKDIQLTRYIQKDR
jgi:hypothetical protein